MDETPDAPEAARTDELISKAQTARTLGLSERAIARHAHAGRLERIPLPRPGGGEQTFYRVEQVERLRAYLAEPRRPGSSAGGRTDALTVQASGALAHAQSEQAAALVEIARALETLAAARPALPPAPAGDEGQVREAPAVPIADKLLLDLRECAALTGLGRGYLRKQIGKRGLRARKLGGRWRVKRADLERFVSKLY